MNEQLLVYLLIFMVLTFSTALIIALLLFKKTITDNYTYNAVKRRNILLSSIEDMVFTIRDHTVFNNETLENIDNKLTQLKELERSEKQKEEKNNLKAAIELLKSCGVFLAKDESSNDYPMYVIGIKTDNGKLTVRTLKNKEEYNLLKNIFNEAQNANNEKW